jgi:hypothetical protein
MREFTYQCTIATAEGPEHIGCVDIITTALLRIYGKDPLPANRFARAVLKHDCPGDQIPRGIIELQVFEYRFPDVNLEPYELKDFCTYDLEVDPNFKTLLAKIYPVELSVTTK